MDKIKEFINEYFTNDKKVSQPKRSKLKWTFDQYKYIIGLVVIVVLLVVSIVRDDGSSKSSSNSSTKTTQVDISKAGTKIIEGVYTVAKSGGDIKPGRYTFTYDLDMDKFNAMDSWSDTSDDAIYIRHEDSTGTDSDYVPAYNKSIKYDEMYGNFALDEGSKNEVSVKLVAGDTVEISSKEGTWYYKK